MSLYIITVVLFLALILSIKNDARRLRNPILLMLFLTCLYLSIATFAHNNGYETFHAFVFGFGFIILPLIVLGNGIFLIYNGIIVLRKEGKSLANALSLLLGVAIVAFYALAFWRISTTIPLYNYAWFNIIFSFLVYTFLLFNFSFIGFLLYSILYNIIPKNRHYDFIIIHGAGLINGETVTPLLQKRIDKAILAYHQSKNKQVKLIASGGQGSDEKISEAQAIANYLYEQNIPKDVVILEDQSRTTYENLLFSKQIGETLIDNPRFLFVTNDYHVFRTSTYAHQIKMVGDGLGCSTAGYYIPSAFIREYIAIVVRLKKIFIALYILFFLAIVLSYLPF